MRNLVLNPRAISGHLLSGIHRIRQSLKTGPKKHPHFVVITIDNEARRERSPEAPVDRLFWGRYQGREYGIPMIMDMADAFGYPAIFFTDTLTVRSYGKEPIREVCQEVLRRGHDCALHSHPELHIPDYQDRFDYYWTDEGVRSWLGEASDYLAEFTGQPTRAYRAGGYRVSPASFRAMRDIGIEADFSSLLGHKQCMIDASYCNNGVRKYDGVYEVPVSVYHDVKGTPRKLDVNWRTPETFRWHLQEAMAAGVLCTTIFLHSWSFLKFDATWLEATEAVGVDEEAIANFQGMLEVVSETPGTQVVTSLELIDYLKANPDALNAPDTIPAIRPAAA
ncbi:Polysaccharide deacetylase [Symmachiella dynata]|uniref:Polysaccharide deacetylase n=1 Tax=Symmachiella dynata TaxID=2527995 RepID=A0A517ZH05_9PLAN|nr:Polysaccharide deacetylase [Symmachiella dynata]